jgi:hypothetical protein
MLPIFLLIGYRHSAFGYQPGKRLHSKAES